MHDAVCVNVKGDFDLGNTPRRWWQVNKLELAERLVVRRHFSFTLQYVDFHRRLHVFGGCKHFGAAGWNCGVAFNELGHHTALRLNAK